MPEDSILAAWKVTVEIMEYDTVRIADYMCREEGGKHGWWEKDSSVRSGALLCPSGFTIYFHRVS